MQTQNTPANNAQVMSQSLNFPMSPKAMELAENCTTRKSLLICLSQNQCYSDAIKLLSYAMPHQQGIQWAHNCVRQSAKKAPNTEKENTLNATQQWINKPNAQNREDVLPLGTVAKPSSATWLAMATYWSGGCINNTENQIEEPTPTDLVNDSIYSSVMLSVQEIEKKNQFAAYNDAVNQGIKILYA